MRPPRSRDRRRGRALARTKKLALLLDLLALIDALDELDTAYPKKRRRKPLMPRQRVPWSTYTRPMLGDGTFKGRFRMDYDDFMVLVELLRNDLQRNVAMGNLRNGAVPVEYQVAITLRWLAGASIYEGMDGHVIARSTAYAICHRVIDALNACRALDCKWPEGDGVLRNAAAFKQRSSWDVIDEAIGAMDGLYILIIKPNRHDHAATHSFYSGHKKAFGMNFQVSKNYCCNRVFSLERVLVLSVCVCFNVALGARKALHVLSALSLCPPLLYNGIITAERRLLDSCLPRLQRK